MPMVSVNIESNVVHKMINMTYGMKQQPELTKHVANIGAKYVKFEVHKNISKK